MSLRWSATGWRNWAAGWFHQIGHRISPSSYEYRILLDGEEVFSVIFEGGFVAMESDLVEAQLFCNDVLVER